MKCIILHESKKKMRIKVPQLRMSLRQADIVEYYLKNLSEVKNVIVYDRTSDVVITFENSVSEGKAQVIEAFENFNYKDEKILALVPEETGRVMNREYEEVLFWKFAGKLLKKLYCPVSFLKIIVIIKSIPYIYNGLKALMRGKIEVPILDATAIIASILRGDFATAGSIMFLLSVGDTLEEWTRKKSVGDLARSMSLSIDKVWLKGEDGEILVDINKIKEGDEIVVRTSEIIALDGIVSSGEMTVNQSTMTGESEPVFKKEGGYVYAGTVVEDGECTIKVTKISGSGKYDQIVHMIEESEKLKSSTEEKAYKLADRLVPYSFGGAALTYALTGNVTKALAFLLVDYSCAMKLSMPLAVLSAMKEARERKIYIKGGKFMEAIADAQTIVFDKTGTLTHATPKLMDVVTFGGRDKDEMLKIAACLEEHYPHSVANAIVDGAKKKNLFHEEMHSKVEYIVAHGVSSFVNDEKVIIGSYHFVIEDEHSTIPENEKDKLEDISLEYSRIFLAIAGELAAVLCIFDPLREEAAEVIDALHKSGVSKICMMTGDNRKTAEAIASKLGLDEYYAEVLPEDKAKFIKKEHEAGRKVIMIGDGVNDAPALSEADVGIAIEDGAAIAREVADVTIAADNLMKIVEARQISKALMSRIRRNYRFILSFNSALIGGGVLGTINPATSALLHNGSTIITGLNSMTDLMPEIKFKEKLN